MDTGAGAPVSFISVPTLEWIETLKMVNDHQLYQTLSKDYQLYQKDPKYPISDSYTDADFERMIAQCESRLTLLFTAHYEVCKQRRQVKS
jgi:hypothetical protein